MKKYYRSVLGALMLSFGLAANAQEPNVPAMTFDKSVSNFHFPEAKAKMPALMKGSSVKVPTVITQFAFNGTDWIPLYKSNRSYSKELLIVEELITDYQNYGSFAFQSIVNEYDENNCKIKATTQLRFSEADDFMNNAMEYYTYDEICHDVKLSCEVNFWSEENQSWFKAENDENNTFNYYTDVQRNEAGNVLLKQFWMDTVAGLGYYYTYDGDSNVATQITAKFLNENAELVEQFRWEDVTWHKSNGQYLKTSSNLFYSFTEDPENIIKHFVLYDLKNGEKYKYAECKSEVDDQGRITSFTILDYFGTNIYTENVYDITPEGDKTYFMTEFNDANGNGAYDEGEAIPSYLQSMTKIYCDKYHNVIKNEFLECSEETGQIDICASMTTWDYKYLEDGTITEVVETEYSYGEEKRRTKYLYEDFVDSQTTGIDEMTGSMKKLVVNNGCVNALNMEGAEYTISDIQGRICRNGVVADSKISLLDLAEGLYIVNVDGRSVKVVKK